MGRADISAFSGTGTLTPERGADLDADQVATAHAHAARLAALARALWDVTGSRPAALSPCGCGRRPCVLAGTPGGVRACTLARDLAALPLGRDVTVIAEGEAEAAAAYLRALRDATGAVFTCRRLLHSGGSCWFRGHGVPRDVCARILTVSHLLGGYARS